MNRGIAARWTSVKVVSSQKKQPRERSRGQTTEALKVMKPTQQLTKIVAVAAIVSGLSLVARAQIGTGWTTDITSHTLQQVGPSAFYSNSGGVETFRIFS